MRLFLYLFFLITLLFSSHEAKTSIYAWVSLNDGQTLTGEYIERFEDRWFYEENDASIEKFILLFERKNNRPVFHFINEKEVEDSGFLNIGPSIYKEHLQENHLLFKNQLVKDAHVLTGNDGHHKFERMFGNFAWDIGILDILGNPHSDNGQKNSDYYIFNAPVHAPLKGIVVGKVDGQEDNPADPTFSSNLSNKLNNYLTIKVSEGFFLSLVHFKKNTITVDVGDQVKVNQILGAVGNSGVSYVPHLHYTLYTYIEDYQRFISVPGFFQEDLN
jgi:hypothetical protein